jgi:hypothetical protein
MKNIIESIKSMKPAPRYHLNDDLSVHACHDPRCKREHYASQDEAMDAGESIAESKAAPLPPLTKRTE